MNRLLLKSVVVLVAGVLVAGAAHGSDKPKKHKKNQDLSANPLANDNSKQPDKELFDKAMIALKKGRFDVARLDLQTLLNTYPSSEYQMRAKLAIGDTWFKEGGTAALAQAEAEYKDFETFFPNAPEAAEAQMKVADIYFQQMEKPDRDYTNVMRAEQEYRNMINQYPDSGLVPRARQKLREVQEVMAEREAEIGFFYESRQNWSATLARLKTVADTYPLYSKSDQVWLAIGDAYEGEAHAVQSAPNLPGAVRERLHSVYLDRAAEAYDKVITRYPMAPHVEEARDRLIQLNRPVPEPTEAAIKENEAIVNSMRPVRITKKALGLIMHGPEVAQAAHVGDPTMDPPKRTTAPEITKENVATFNEALHGPGGIKPAEVKPTGANEPPRSDQPSTAPLQFENVNGSGNGVGVSIVNAPAGNATTTTPSGNAATTSGDQGTTPATDKNAVLKPVGPSNTVEPKAEAPATAPEQINEVKPQSTPVNADTKKQKAPKADLSDESSSKKKKKKGLHKLNPF